MSYALKLTDSRTKNKLYVARSGYAHSYTHLRHWIKVFPTVEAAEKERCVENEVVVNLTVTGDEPI